MDRGWRMEGKRRRRETKRHRIHSSQALSIRKLTECRFRREKQQSREEKQANISMEWKVLVAGVSPLEPHLHRLVEPADPSALPLRLLFPFFSGAKAAWFTLLPAWESGRGGVTATVATAEKEGDCMSLLYTCHLADGL